MDDSFPSTPPPPPPLAATPPLITAPAKPPKRGRGWMIVAIILLVLLGISVLFNLGSLFSSLTHLEGGYRQSAGPRLDEVLVEDNSAKLKIAVIPIEGIITSQALDQSGNSLVEIIEAQLERAEKDHRVRAVLLKVDSPGGEVLASDEINKMIADFQKVSGKPVVASMGSLAASGGYYVSAPCRWIVAHDMTITGSIGVIISTWNYRGLMNKVGIQPFTYKSGKFKDMLSGSRDPSEIPPEERQMLQDVIDKTYTKFRNVVKEGRAQAARENKDTARPLAGNWQEYADGRILIGTEAYDLGFVDEIGNFDDAVDRALDIAGIDEANLVEYRLRYDLADLFRLFGQSESRAVKIDLGLEAPKLEAGKPYFLYLP